MFLCGSFLRIGSLVFSETLYGVRSPYEDMHDSLIIGETPLPTKMTQSWPFLTFRKIYSLVLSGNGAE